MRASQRRYAGLATGRRERECACVCLSRGGNASGDRNKGEHVRCVIDRVDDLSGCDGAWERQSSCQCRRCLSKSTSPGR
eukprot:1344130-Rhodomonas_salina.1